MPIFITPFVISLVIITLLLVFAISFIFKKFFNQKSSNLKTLGVLRIKPSFVDRNFSGVLASLKVPLSFEIVVEQFGKEIEYYVVTHSKNIPKIIHILEAQETEDYEIYHHGGVTIGGYVKAGSVSSLEFNKIDFSRVNSIGEGAVVQFLFWKRKNGGSFLNIRALASAPSEYQAREILNAVKKTMPGNFVDVKSADFLKKIHFRKFDRKEQVFFEK